MKGFYLVLCGMLALAIFPGISQAGIGAEFNGKASFGGSLGVMQWFADSDARDYTAPADDPVGGGGGAQIRPMLTGSFRYRNSEKWVLCVNTGFGWNSYPDTDDLTLRVVPITVGLEKRIGDLWGTTTYLGFGGGFYHWVLRRGRDVQKDPETFKELSATEPGVYGSLTGEFHLSENVSITTQTAIHFMYSVHGDDFKGMLGGNDIYAEMRLGLNCYFSPSIGFGKEEETD